MPLIAGSLGFDVAADSIQLEVRRVDDIPLLDILPLEVGDLIFFEDWLAGASASTEPAADDLRDPPGLDLEVVA
ncbi:MAG: hypothetical protein ACE5GB_00705 [Acidimicrobiales bacterium]